MIGGSGRASERLDTRRTYKRVTLGRALFRSVNRAGRLVDGGRSTWAAGSCAADTDLATFPGRLARRSSRTPASGTLSRQHSLTRSSLDGSRVQRLVRSQPRPVLRPTN
jgi:hypothetical protein